MCVCVGGVAIDNRPLASVQHVLAWAWPSAVDTCCANTDVISTHAHSVISASLLINWCARDLAAIDWIWWRHAHLSVWEYTAWLLIAFSSDSHWIDSLVDREQRSYELEAHLFCSFKFHTFSSWYRCDKASLQVCWWRCHKASLQVGWWRCDKADTGVTSRYYR